MPSLRPSVVQHAIWYEKEKFFTQLKLNAPKKSLEALMQSPEPKWNGKKVFPLSSSRIFCFFSQLPECVKAHGLLDKKERPQKIHLIWDNYPYHQEMYDKIGEEPVVLGVWAFDKATKDGQRFGFVVEGQLILYEFDPSGNFKSMFWVAQGITLNKKE